MELKNNLSSFDMIIIRQQLSKLPDNEIAEIVGQPIDVITAVIHQLTGGGLIRKSKSQVILAKHIAQQNKGVNKKVTSLNKERADRQYKSALSNQSAMHKQKEKVYATKVTDYNEKVLLRIDAKTSIYINKTDDPDTEKQKYLNRLATSAVEVEEVSKKLKPKDRPEKKKCIRCEKNKPLGDFRRLTDAIDGRAGRCKECDDKVQKIKEWEKRNKN